MKPYLIIGALLLIMAVGVQGYRMGAAANEARHTANALKQAKADADATAKLAAVEQQRRLLALALEDEAHADPVAVSVCLSAERVRRLNLR